MALPKLNALGCLLSLGLTSVAASSAHAYTIDGMFSDWGIHHTTLVSSTAREQVQEDQHDNFLNPGYGGQRYDAEAIYLDWDATYFYVGVLTGLPSNNTHNPSGNSYGPGDIIFDFNYSEDDNPEFALKLRNAGGLTKGKLYAPGTWEYGIWSAPGVLANGSNPSTDIVGIKTGTEVANTTLVYNNTYTTGLGQWTSDKHYFIEARIPLSAFGGHWAGTGPREALNVHWSALCANDIIVVDPAPVSEPGVAGLLGLALGSIAVVRRKARKSARK